MPVQPISALAVRNRLGQILEETHYLGKEFIVERSGKPMAVIIPLDIYQMYLKNMTKWTQEAEEDALKETLAVRHGKGRL